MTIQERVRKAAGSPDAPGGDLPPEGTAMVALAVVGAEEAAVEFADYPWQRLQDDLRAAKAALACAARAADPRWVERHVESAEAILEGLREYNRAYRMRKHLQ